MPRVLRPHEPRNRCVVRSSLNTSSADSTNRDTPSGWEQAPRPRTTAAVRRAVSRVSIPPEPSASALIERARPGRPSLHGPHCPDDSLAR